MRNNPKTGNVVVQRYGKTIVADYTVTRGMITVHGKNGSKTTKLGGSSAAIIAKELLCALMDEDVDEGR